MELRESVVEGDQLMQSARTETRISYAVISITLGTQSIEVPIRDEITTETVEEMWYALTKAAAEAERDANIQPEAADESYTYAVILDNPQAQAYRLIRVFQRVTKVRTTDIDSTPDVTFSPEEGVYPTQTELGAPLPLAVTLNCSDADAWIFYEIATDAVPQDPTTGSDKVPAGEAISVQLTPDQVTTIKAVANVYGSAFSAITSVQYTGETLPE